MRLQKEILEIFEILSANDPAPKSELEYSNAFTLLVAIVLSAQSTDKGVNKATRELFKIADTPAKMAALGVERLKEYIKTIGLYNNKAKNVIAMSEILVRDYNGEVPEDQAQLESLPGVGHKTANVLRNVWYGKPTMAVDTHVFRIAHRLDFSQGKTVEAVEKDLLKVLPEKYLMYANHWLVLFGRYVCKAQKPDCANCPVSAYCHSPDKRVCN